MGPSRRSSTRCNIVAAPASEKVCEISSRRASFITARRHLIASAGVPSRDKKNVSFHQSDEMIVSSASAFAVHIRTMITGLGRLSESHGRFPANALFQEPMGHGLLVTLHHKQPAKVTTQLFRNFIFPVQPVKLFQPGEGLEANVPSTGERTSPSCIVYCCLDFPSVSSQQPSKLTDCCVRRYGGSKSAGGDWAVNSHQPSKLTD